MMFGYYRLAARVNTSGAPATQAITPDNTAFEVTDFSGTIVRNSTRIQLIRPFDTGDGPSAGGGLRYAAPAARVRFGCILAERSEVKVVLESVPRVTRPDVQNAVGSILVNNSFVRDFSTGGDVSITLDPGTYAIEVLMPRGWSYDVRGAAIPATGVFIAPTPRPASRWVFVGDSITNGIAASRSRVQWSTLLAQAKGVQQINLAYGGRRIEPSDFTYAGGVQSDRCVGNPGINNCFAGDSPATVQSLAEQSITNFRVAATAAGQPNKPLYWINLFDCTNPGLVTPPASARSAIAAAFTAVGGANDFLIPGGTANGLPSGDTFPDKTHPDDPASATIASVLTGLL